MIYDYCGVRRDRHRKAPVRQHEHRGFLVCGGYDQGTPKDYLAVSLVVAWITTSIANPFEIQDAEIVVPLAFFSPIRQRFSVT